MEWVKLGDIISIKKGKKLLEVDEPTENSIRYIQIEDLRDDNNLKYTEDDKAVLSDIDDILIAWDGANAGTIGFGISGAIGSTIAKLSIKKSFRKKFTYEFLGYFLKSKNNYLVATSTGATIPHISRNALIKIKVPIIDLEEQEKLIGIFKNLENLIQTRKDQIQALDDLVESVFQNTLSDNNIFKIKDVAYVNPAKSEVKNLDPNTVISFVPMEDVSENGVLKLSKTKTIGDAYKGFTYFRDNDVVIAKITPCFENGKGALMKNLVNGIGFGTTEFHVLRTKDENILNPIWLNYLTRTKYFRCLGEIRMSGSAGQKRIGKDFVENFKFSLPPLDQQNKFASLVEKIEEQKEILNSSLGELTDLFDCLMQDAFDGSLIK